MIHLSENGLTVLRSRYLLKGGDGRLEESPEDLFRRVSVFISEAELEYSGESERHFWEDRFYDLLSTLQFLPNSPTLMNAGTPNGQLSACYVLPVSGSTQSIRTSLAYALEIQKSGGGTGFNFSKVYMEDGLSDREAVVCIPEFDQAMNSIKQIGKRSGANMAILNIDHPEIENFISSKLQSGKLTNFNISVGIKDEFMNALERNDVWSLVHPSTGKLVKKVPALKLWDEIIKAAWRTGDPGLVFLDTIERANPTPELGSLYATNPCGEVPLLDFEACNLGSINLPLMARREGRRNKLDWEKLRSVIPVCIRFLDNVISVNNYFIPTIERIVKGNRKIGLGVMGWAELLVKVGLQYDSEEAVMLGEKLMRFIQQESYKASALLAMERGNFPNWKRSRYFPDRPLRNATVNSIAPTGTISIIANTSSSIEPFFALSFQRKNVLDGKDIYEINPLVNEYLEKYGSRSQQLKHLIEEKGSLNETDPVPGRLFDLFKTSLQVDYTWHIKHQSAFQKYTDNAVSKTINLPEEATVKTVDSIYRSAWQKGLKGITIYRYGCKQDQVLYQGVSKEKISVLSGSCKYCIG